MSFIDGVGGRRMGVVLWDGGGGVGGVLRDGVESVEEGGCYWVG